jgi:hypothetical protein
MIPRYLLLQISGTHLQHASPIIYVSHRVIFRLSSQRQKRRVQPVKQAEVGHKQSVNIMQQQQQRKVLQGQSEKQLTWIKERFKNLNRELCRTQMTTGDSHQPFLTERTSPPAAGITSIVGSPIKFSTVKTEENGTRLVTTPPHHPPTPPQTQVWALWDIYVALPREASQTFHTHQTGFS